MKGFWGELFCKHSYKRITEWHKVYLSTYQVAGFQCQKCGKYKIKKLKKK